MPECPHKIAARKKRWYQNHIKSQQDKARTRAQHTRNRRRALLEFSCICCGECDQTVIQWHHVDESQKLFSLFGGSTPSEDAWWLEVLKCIPVCANCHVKIHKEKLCLIPISVR